MTKEQEIKKIKDEMVDKYRFQGESGKKPKQAAIIEEKTMVDWWIKKVQDYRLA